LLIGIGAPVPSRIAVSQTSTIASGGLGLSRSEWEAVFGAGEPGQSYMIYTYPTFGATMHVGVDTTVNTTGIVDYFYIPLAETPVDTGLDRELTLSMIASLLPHDSRLRESFVRTETPGSLMMVTTELWSSRSLGLVLDGRRSILVRYTEGPDATVSLVTIDVERG
jgi:hypothetical protein